MAKLAAARGVGPNAFASSAASVAPSSRSMTILSKESGIEYKKENYSSRMAKTHRPVSPHVTIYAWPVGALTSIVNRVTGVTLSFGAAGLGAAELVGGNGAALDLMSSIGSGAVGGGLVVAGAKFAVAFPFAYHYMGGARHLMWDSRPEMLTNVDVEKASWALVGASVLVGGVSMVV